MREQPFRLSCFPEFFQPDESTDGGIRVAARTGAETTTEDPVSEQRPDNLPRYRSADPGDNPLAGAQEYFARRSASPSSPAPDSSKVAWNLDSSLTPAWRPDATSNLSRALELALSPTDRLPANPPSSMDLEPGYREYKRNTDEYWARAEAHKRAHEPITEFAPVYTGPGKPPRPYVTPKASLNEMLAETTNLNRIAYKDGAAADFHFGHVDEMTYKRRYVNEALRVGRQNGFSEEETKDIVRRVYAFENGGIGTRETVSDMPERLQRGETEAQQQERRNFHPRYSAIGYNQLTIYDSMRKLDQDGGPIIARMNQIAKEEPARSQVLTEKAHMLGALQGVLREQLHKMINQDRMKEPKDQQHYVLPDGTVTQRLYIDMAKSDAPTAAGITAKQLAQAIHVLSIDGDIGPVVQSQELANLLKYGRSHHFQQLLEDNEKRLSENATKYDRLMPDQKKLAVDELIERVSKNEANAESPEAKLRHRLLTLMPGDTHSLEKLTGRESELLSAIADLKRYGDEKGPVSPQATLLLDKITYVKSGGAHPSTLLPAALELANLAGTGQALRMLRSQNANLPTTNFFARDGYEGNPSVQGRTSNELLMRIHWNMYGRNGTPNRAGIAEFLQLFGEADKTHA